MEASPQLRGEAIPNGGLGMSSKQWAQFYDNKIFELAFYYESKGMSIPVVQPEKIHGRFSDFKRNLLDGEFTFQELEERIYNKFGLMPAANPVNNFLQALQDLSDERMKQDGKAKEKEDVSEDSSD